MERHACLLLLILLLPAACSSSDPLHDSAQHRDPQNASLVKRTEYGYVRGIETQTDARAWLGIPYAEPPIGELRWTSPQDPKAWEDVLVTDTFCSGCTQYSGYFTYMAPLVQFTRRIRTDDI